MPNKGQKLNYNFNLTLSLVMLIIFYICDFSNEQKLIKIWIHEQCIFALPHVKPSAAVFN